MKKILRIGFKLIIRPDEFAALIIEKKYYKQGVIIALLGLFSIYLSYYVAPLIWGHFDVFLLKDIPKAILKAVIYYMIFVSLTYTACKLLKGKGSFVGYIQLIGWAYLPMMVIPISANLIGPLVAFDTTDFTLRIGMLLLGLFFSGLTYLSIYIAIRLTISFFKALMHLDTKRAVLVYIISVMPLISIYYSYF